MDAKPFELPSDPQTLQAIILGLHAQRVPSVNATGHWTQSPIRVAHGK
jgi:hypothetical protein